MRIWKWPLTVTDRQTLPLPDGAEVLAVQVHGDTPHLWALVDEKAALARRVFATYGTGHRVPDCPGIYLGTYQIHGGALVFHVFEEEVERKRA